MFKALQQHRQQHRITRFVRRAIVLCCLSVCLFGLTACSIKPIKPWLKPYERQNLADPIMSFEEHPVQGSYMHHVLQGRESARGAEGGAGGGCGCN